jgi:hypothetical protein
MEDLGAYIFFGLTVLGYSLAYIRKSRENKNLKTSLKDAEEQIKMLEAENNYMADTLLIQDEDLDLQDEIEEMINGN